MINKEDMEIKSQWIADPPEKVQLMYEAVCGLIREHAELSKLKVQDITSRAGIGKGTAYEYFSSKEEIVLHAVLYEYFRQTQELEKKAFAPESFQERFYTILDWMKDNQEYNRLFSWTMRDIFSEFAFGEMNPCGKLNTPVCSNPGNTSDKEPGEFEKQAAAYMFAMIQRFMEYGRSQGAFTEENPRRQTMALFSAIMEYLMVITSPEASPLHTTGEKELRSFIYRSMTAALSLN